MREAVYWGYDLPMYVCGVAHAHVDNVYHLQKSGNYSSRDMYEIIRSLPTNKRTRYGMGYSKSDFTDLDIASELYKKETDK